MEAMEPELLRTGERVPRLIVNATVEALTKLLNADPVAFAEIVRHCRDRDHELTGTYRARIMAVASSLMLEERGSVHELVQHVIVSAVEGDGLHMRIVDPRKPAPQDTPPDPTA